VVDLIDRSGGPAMKTVSDPNGLVFTSPTCSTSSRDEGGEMLPLMF
jgi:hypothetical protein